MPYHSYDYNQKRKNAGLKPLAIADPQWNPTAQDDDANEALAQWYRRHGSLPRDDQQIGFNRMLKLYRAEKRMHGGDGETRPASAADPLAGGLSRLNGNESGARLQNLYSGSTAAALQAINNQADEQARQKAESGKGNPSIYMANEDPRQDDQKRRQANLAAAAKAWELENPTLNTFAFPSVEKAAAMVAAQNQPGKTPELPSDTQSTEDPGPVLGRILSFETGLMNGSAGWAIDLQNTINQNNTPSLGNGLQPYNEVKDTLQKKYPGAFLAGDLTGMVASGYFYGPGSKTADALEAASRRMAPEVVESAAGRQFGKQVFRGASVAERTVADEAAVKAAQALAENNATNSPLLAALDDVIAGNSGLARQAERGYTQAGRKAAGETLEDAVAAAREGVEEAGTLFTKGSPVPEDILNAKPHYSPAVDKWLEGGGQIKIEKGTWKYTDSTGISVIYKNNHPDFKGSGHVLQEVNIGPIRTRSSDFRLADRMAPNGPKSPNSTWHHHEDGVTLQEVNRRIHALFTHKGGVSIVRKGGG